jgi:hypothetical protein
MAEIKVTTGDTLYGVVEQRKVGNFSLKLAGIVRDEKPLTLLGTSVKVSLERILGARHLKDKRYPVVFSKSFDRGERNAANKLAKEVELALGETSTSTEVVNSIDPKAITSIDFSYQEDDSGRYMPAALHALYKNVSPMSSSTVKPPIVTATAKAPQKITLVRKEKKPPTESSGSVVVKKEECVVSSGLTPPVPISIDEEFMRRRVILDPEDSDMDDEVPEDAEEGTEFKKECEPILSRKAEQSMRDASHKSVLAPEVEEMLFRVGPFESLRVTQMKGADLKMLSMLRRQPRKDESWLGFATSTSDEHINIIKLMASNVREEDPLIETLIDAFEKLRVIREWRWSTTLKRAASLQGALAILPLYFKGCVPIFLKQSPVWVKQLTHYSKKTKEEAPKQAKPTTADQMMEVIRLFRGKNNAVAVALMLGWLTAARLGCVLQLQVEDVRISQQRFSVTFKRGKGVRLRGPYTVYSALLPQEWMEIWEEYRPTRTVKMFSESVTGAKLKEALRAVDSELEQRSIRRGALQTMAENGTSEEDLMRFSGHTQVATLRRYLNWNQINRKVESSMAATGEALLPTALAQGRKQQPAQSSKRQLSSKPSKAKQPLRSRKATAPPTTTISTSTPTHGGAKSGKKHPAKKATSKRK